MIVIKHKNVVKSVLAIALIFITGCQAGFLGIGPSRMDMLEGQWTWSNGTDSLWVELKKK